MMVHHLDMFKKPWKYFNPTFGPLLAFGNWTRKGTLALEAFVKSNPFILYFTGTYTHEQ